tara:strand:- start:1154 stop:1771 length:618 start_codon:yes stop_codon:yes gene_type:complete
MNHKNIVIVILLLLLLFLFVNNESVNDNILYIPNFLNKEDYKKILGLRNNKNDFIFERFRYAKPLKSSMPYEIFYDDKYIHQIEINLDKKLYPSKFPIEHRYYPKDSPGMPWHKDLLMYKKPQYEGIFTIRNNTKSLTEWKDSKGKIHRLWTEPNSLLLVKAQGYEHHVTPPSEGEREILKLIYTQTEVTNDNYDEEMKRFKSGY